MLIVLLIVVGIGLLLLAYRVARRGAGRWRRTAVLGAILLGLSGVVSLLAGGFAYWYTHRSQPAPRTEELFSGITHIVQVRQAPRPMVIHVVRIDLREQGISFLVTPAEPTGGRAMKARTTSGFVREFGVQFAMNANYFFPFRSETPLDYYPREGDPVDVCGFAASRGTVYSRREWVPGTVYLSEDNRASFDEPIGAVYNAIAGNGFLVKAGRSQAPFDGDALYPRAALGVDRERRFLVCFIIDGKQPGYSEGATLSELSQTMIEHGVWDGVRIDEGGSSTMVMQDGQGKSRVLNSPINHRIPGWERVVANHLGVYATRKCTHRQVQ